MERRLLRSYIIGGCFLAGSAVAAATNPIQLDEERIRHLLKVSRPTFHDNEYGTEYLPDITTVDYRGLHSNERGLQQSLPYRPLNINFITEPLIQSKDKDDPNSKKNQNIDLIIDQVLPAVAETWSRHLSVNSPQYMIDIDGSSCFGFFDEELENTNTMEYDEADLFIIVGGEDTLYTSTGLTNKVCQDNSLATAKACTLDQYERPVIGFINFCVEDRKVYNSMDIQETTLVATHNAAHVLGMDITLMLYFKDTETNEPLTDRPLTPRDMTCVDGSQRTALFPSEKTIQLGNTSNGLFYHDIVTKRVQAVARNHLDCQILPGARLENLPEGSSACTGNDWDERLFSSNMMSSVFGGVHAAGLSPLTLAVLDDSGWYKVDYHGTKLSPAGHGMGCDYANSPCIVNDEVPDYGKGIFCNTPIELDGNHLYAADTPMHCDVTHTKFGLCDLFHIDDTNIDPESRPMSVRYFTDTSLVTKREEGDFCPMVTIDVGIDCTMTYDSNSARYPGETFGPGSKCINAIDNGKSHPACLQTECSETLGKVTVAGNVCDFDGQEKSFGPEGLVFVCPRLRSVCPQLFCPTGCNGRGKCNYETRQCECFDASDTSPECDNSLVTVAEVVDDQSEPPSPEPTPQPTKVPTTSRPSRKPSITFYRPTATPSGTPTATITATPTIVIEDESVTMPPTDAPSKLPILSPTLSPTAFPTKDPTRLPTTAPIQPPTARVRNDNKGKLGSITGSWDDEATPTSSPVPDTFAPTASPPMANSGSPTSSDTESPTDGERPSQTTALGDDTTSSGSGLSVLCSNAHLPLLLGMGVMIAL